MSDETVGAGAPVVRYLHEIYARRKVGKREACLVLHSDGEVFEHPAVEIEEFRPLQTAPLQGESVAVVGQM